MVEMVLVIVILAIVAAIAAQRFGDTAERAKVNTFIYSLRTNARAMEVYFQEHQAWPPSSTGNTMPAELAAFADATSWAAGSELGGAWQLDTEGPRPSIGVEFPSSVDARAQAALLEVDRLLDDGDLSTGNFVKGTGHTYMMSLAP